MSSEQHYVDPVGDDQQADAESGGVTATPSRVAPLQDALDVAIKESASLLQRLRDASRADEDERERNSILAQTLTQSLDATTNELAESKKREEEARSSISVQTQQIEALVDVQKHLLCELEEEQDRAEGLVLDKMVLLEWTESAKQMMADMTESLNQDDDEDDLPTSVIAEREQKRADLNKRFEKASKALSVVVKRGVPRFVGNPQDYAERQRKQQKAAGGGGGAAGGGSGGKGWSWSIGMPSFGGGGGAARSADGASSAVGGDYSGAAGGGGASLSSSGPPIQLRGGPGANNSKSSSSSRWDWSSMKSAHSNLALFSSLFRRGRGEKGSSAAGQGDDYDSATGGGVGPRPVGEGDDDSATCVEVRADCVASAPPTSFDGRRADGYGEEFWQGEWQEEVWEDSDAEDGDEVQDESLAEAAGSYAQKKKRGGIDGDGGEEEDGVFVAGKKKKKNLANEIKDKLMQAQVRSRESNQSVVKLKKQTEEQAAEIKRLKTEKHELAFKAGQLEDAMADMKSRVKVAASRVLKFAREKDDAKAGLQATQQSLRQSDALCRQLQETLNVRTTELQRARKQLRMIQQAIDEG